MEHEWINGWQAGGLILAGILLLVCVVGSILSHRQMKAIDRRKEAALRKLMARAAARSAVTQPMTNDPSAWP